MQGARGDPVVRKPTDSPRQMRRRCIRPSSGQYRVSALRVEDNPQRAMWRCNQIQPREGGFRCLSKWQVVWRTNERYSKDFQGIHSSQLSLVNWMRHPTFWPQLKKKKVKTFAKDSIADYQEGLWWDFAIGDRGRLHQFSHSVMSDSLQPRGLQHTRPPCPSPTSGTY